MMNVTVACAYGENTFTTTITSKSDSSARTENPIEIKEIHLFGAPKDFFSGKLTGKVELKDASGNEESVSKYKFDESNNVLKIFVSNNLILSNDSQFIFSINV